MIEIFGDSDSDTVNISHAVLRRETPKTGEDGEDELRTWHPFWTRAKKKIGCIRF